MAIRKRRTIIEVARRGRAGKSGGEQGPPGEPGEPAEPRARLPEWDFDEVNPANYASSGEDQRIDLFTFPIGSNEKWIVTYVLRAACTGTGGIVFRLYNPLGATARVLGHSEGAGGQSAYSSSSGNGSAMNPVLLPVAGGIRFVMISATIVTGDTPGEVSLDFKRGTVGQTATIYNNSYVSARRAVTLQEAEDAIDEQHTHNHDDIYYRAPVVDGMLTTINDKVDALQQAVDQL